MRLRVVVHQPRIALLIPQANYIVRFQSNQFQARALVQQRKCTAVCRVSDREAPHPLRLPESCYPTASVDQVKGRFGDALGELYRRAPTKPAHYKHTLSRREDR